MEVIGYLVTFNDKIFITNHKYVDANDLRSILIVLGRDVGGGRKIYYHSKYDKQVAHVENFQYKKYQVGLFDSVYCKGNEWKVVRGIVSFYISRTVYYHFLRHRLTCYEKRLERSNKGTYDRSD